MILDCRITNSVYNLNELDASNFGFLTNVSLKTLFGKKYIHFKNEASDEVQTMLVCVQNENITPEVEVT